MVLVFHTEILFPAAVNRLTYTEYYLSLAVIIINYYIIVKCCASRHSNQINRIKLLIIRAIVINSDPLHTTED
jgi:hypothetical protein